MYSERKEILQRLQLVIGLGCVGLSYLIFLPLMAGTGQYFPLAYTRIYLDDNTWTNDSQYVQFWVESPFRSHYKMRTDGTDLQVTGLLVAVPPLEKPDDSHYPSYPESRYGLEEASAIQQSPDRNYLVVIGRKKTPMLRGFSSLYNEDQYLRVVDRRAREVVFETNRVELIRMMRVKLFGYTTTLKTIETIAWLLLDMGLILLAQWLVHTQNRRDSISIGLILFFWAYVFAVFAYLALFSTTVKTF